MIKQAGTHTCLPEYYTRHRLHKHRPLPTLDKQGNEVLLEHSTQVIYNIQAYPIAVTVIASIK